MSILRYTDRTPYVTNEAMLDRLRSMNFERASEDPPKTSQPVAPVAPAVTPQDSPRFEFGQDPVVSDFLKKNPDVDSYLRLSEKLRTADPIVEQPPVRTADLEFMQAAAQTTNPLMQNLSNQILAGVDSRISGTATDRRAKAAEKNAAIKNLQDMLEAQMKFNWQAKNLEELDKRKEKEQIAKLFTVATREAANYIKTLKTQGLLNDSKREQEILTDTNAWAKEQLELGQPISTMDLVQRIQGMISNKISSGAGILYTRDALGNLVKLYNKPSGGGRGGGSRSPKDSPRSSILSSAKARAGK